MQRYKFYCEYTIVVVLFFEFVSYFLQIVSEFSPNICTFQKKVVPLRSQMTNNASHITLFALIVCAICVSCRSAAPHSSNAATVSRIAVTSVTHIGFLDALGALDKVVAVTNKDLVYTPLADSVVDLGDALSPNMELLLQAHVDVVLMCSYAQDKIAPQIERMGIPVVYIDEWKESDPLKRAEWIKPIAQLIGLENRADSIYTEVEAAYERLKDGAKAPEGRCAEEKKVMVGTNYRGTWYMPSGNSYMGALLRDAGYSYAFNNDTRATSIPLSTEAALLKFRDADIWLGCDASSLDELAQLDIHHTWFRAYQTHQVYSWSKQTTKTGANNFWERGVVHPEEILSDLIRISDSDSESDSESERLYYALKLE